MVANSIRRSIYMRRRNATQRDATRRDTTHSSSSSSSSSSSAVHNFQEPSQYQSFSLPLSTPSSEITPRSRSFRIVVSVLTWCMKIPPADSQLSLRSIRSSIKIDPCLLHSLYLLLLQQVMMLVLSSRGRFPLTLAWSSAPSAAMSTWWARSGESPSSRLHQLNFSTRDDRMSGTPVRMSGCRCLMALQRRRPSICHSSCSNQSGALEIPSHIRRLSRSELAVWRSLRTPFSKLTRQPSMSQ
mmetsp:Transcript_12500/g.35515  ORF Transcript_12500/g.35515 Transcript_12500/m.35515 type:complete len:242 (+) Transcript_12500:1319-2044(+)